MFCALLTRTAELFRLVFARTDDVDAGCPRDLATSDQRARVPNLFIKIPGTAEGLPAIEEAIFAGGPVNVTLLFSRKQYLAATGAYLRGVERRIEAGLNPSVASVADG